MTGKRRLLPPVSVRAKARERYIRRLQELHARALNQAKVFLQDMLRASLSAESSADYLTLEYLDGGLLVVKPGSSPDMVQSELEDLADATGTPQTVGFDHLTLTATPKKRKST